MSYLVIDVGGPIMSRLIQRINLLTRIIIISICFFKRCISLFETLEIKAVPLAYSLLNGLSTQRSSEASISKGQENRDLPNQNVKTLL